MSPQGGQDPGQIARWIATGQPSHRAVLRALGDLLVAVADHDEHDTAGAGLDPRRDARGGPVNAFTDRAAAANRARFVAPALPQDASTDDIALWLADSRTRAHQLIDESVTAVQEVLNQRAAAIESGDSTAQAQRHAQRLAIERLRRAVADLTLEVRGVHGRLDRMEGLLRQLAGAPPAARDTAEVASALTEVSAATRATTAALEEIERTTLPSAEQAATEIASDIAPDIASETAPEPALETRADIAEAAAPPPGSSRERATANAPVTPLSDARAAVEAAVASALEEARRAASTNVAPRTEQAAARARAESLDETPADAQDDAPHDRARDLPTAPRQPERPLAWSSRPTLTPPPAVESPRAVLGAPDAPDAPAATPPAEDQAAARNTIERTAQAPATPEAPSIPEVPTTPTAEPTATPTEERAPAAGRPGLWVPPSALAPPRAVPQAPTPEAPRQAEASAPESSSAPASTPAPARAETPAPAMAGTPTVTPTRQVAAVGLPAEPARTSMPTAPQPEAGIFYPDGGPVILRIAPISGFQGLMRVQDSVVQLPAVREATVEAYARGEARLRLQLVAALEPDSLSESLTSSLGTRAGLQAVSDEERSIQIALG